MLVGVGVGWIEGEYGFLGADFRRRGRVLDEAIRVMRNLWTSDRSGFSGEFYQYEDALFFPKPARPGGPPIWIGGNSDAAITRAATLGDGWHADEVAPDEFATKAASLQQQAAANGRAAEATIRYTVDLYGATGTARAGGKTAGHQLGDDAEIGMKGIVRRHARLRAPVSRPRHVALRLSVRARHARGARVLHPDVRARGHRPSVRD